MDWDPFQDVHCEKLGPAAAVSTRSGTILWCPSRKGTEPSTGVPAERYGDCPRVITRPELRGAFCDSMTPRAAQHPLCAGHSPSVVRFTPRWAGAAGGLTPQCPSGRRLPRPPALWLLSSKASSPEAKGLTVPALPGVLCPGLPEKRSWPKLGNLCLADASLPGSAAVRPPRPSCRPGDC